MLKYSGDREGPFTLPFRTYRTTPFVFFIWDGALFLGMLTQLSSKK